MKRLSTGSFLLALAALSSAQNYSTGFEAADGFALGTLPQNGWVLPSVGTNQVSIVGSPVRAGVQSLQIGALGGQAARDLGGNSALAGSLLSLQTDLLFSGTDGPNSADYGVALYGFNGTSTAVSTGNLLADVTLSVSQNTVEVRGKGAGGVLGVSNVTLTSALALNAWYTLRLVVDGTKTTNNVTAFFGPAGGTLTQSGTSTLLLGTYSTFRYAGVESRFAGGVGTGSFDNLALATQPVPEPALLAPLGLGLLALARRRR